MFNNNFDKIRLYIFSIFFLFTSVFCSYAGVHNQPHKIYVLKTVYFDFIFPKQDSQLVFDLSSKADALYEKACEEMNFSKKFRMPVVVSPDNSELSVSYSPSPYNRIIIYDTLASADYFYDPTSIEKLFYTQILKAVVSSIRSRNWEIAHIFIGIDALQPSHLFNVPPAFIEGAVDALSENSFLTDNSDLQLIYMAKLDGCFPNYFQISGVSNCHIYSELEKACCKAFSAYMIQRWGIDKYQEYWQACGKINFFCLMPGIFNRVYGLSLKNAWKNFEESIQWPVDLLPAKIMEGETKSLISSDNTASFISPVKSLIGVVWFDSINNEVCVLNDKNKKTVLFSAYDVYRLALSEDRRYLAVSYDIKRSHPNLKKSQTRVYDLVKKTFIGATYAVRDACVISLPYRKKALAGIAYENDCAVIKMYLLNDELIKDVLYSRKFPYGTVPSLITSPARNCITCVVSDASGQHLLQIKLPDGDETVYNLPFTVLSMQASPSLIAFSYISEGEYSFAKLGCMTTDSKGNLESIKIVSQDIIGGFNDVYAIGSDVIFSLRRAYYSQLKKLNRTTLSFEECAVVKDNAIPFYEKDIANVEKRLIDKDGKLVTRHFLNEYELSSYSSFPYMFQKTIFPMLPIASIDLDDYQMSIGLGATYFTQTDALGNSSAIFSYGKDLANPDNDYKNLVNENTVSVIFNNSTLPISLTAAGLWQFGYNGEYKLKFLGGGKWLFPLGFSFRKITLSLQDIWLSSTTHEDKYSGEEITLDGWTSPLDAFIDNQILLGFQYSSYRQHGLTAFEQLGVEFGLSLIYETDYAQEQNAEDESIYKSTVISGDKYAKLTFTADAGIKVPRLIPLQNHYPFILDLPTEAYISLYGKNGTAWNYHIESLLLGWESQFGIPFANLYMHRAGLSLGYDSTLEYDTLLIPSPDLSNLKEFISVIKTSKMVDFVYLSFTATLSPVIGVSSDIQVSADFQFRYHINEDFFSGALIIKSNI